MSTWFSKQLGDGVLAFAPKEQIQAMFPPLFAAAARPVEMAVFTRHELDGRLQCEVVAYFSPAAEALARQLDAQTCEKPSPTELDLLAGKPDCWAVLFPERSSP
ncbi:hypothetical protein [Rhodoferax sp.]|uniref:hypothetical protein n=1 Tax=Rhodoferax sp. TaxID=50421 RepID=UPI00262BCA52|nr:hypothetical protein [Rhodoferax sp.]MDD3937943.1 hypothetical protein [Rhodoferax sp.]